MLLYHYMDWNGYNGILQSGEIIHSRNTALDAAGGPGAYFTDFTPNSCQVEIMNYCFGKRSGKTIDYFICMDVPKRYVRRFRKHIYLIPEHIPASFHILKHGKRPDCPNKPCSTCPKNTPEVRAQAAPLIEIFGTILGIIAVIGIGIAVIKLLGTLFRK